MSTPNAPKVIFETRSREGMAVEGEDYFLTFEEGSTVEICEQSGRTLFWLTRGQGEHDKDVFYLESPDRERRPIEFCGYPATDVVERRGEQELLRTEQLRFRLRRS